ncbi:MAG TPA: GNAT family N-acetyltransferase [Polyangiaceae bacterium]
MKVCLLGPGHALAGWGDEGRPAQIRLLLEQLGHEVVALACSRTLYAALRRQQPDVVFNCAVPSDADKEHLVPAILEIAKLRYTGAGLLALSLGRNYVRLFPLLASVGIPLPPFRVVESEQVKHQPLAGPVVIYRDGEYSGTLVSSSEALTALLVSAAPHEKLLLVEQPNHRRVTRFALGQEPLFPPITEELGSLVKKCCELIEARGLIRFEFALADKPMLVSVDVAPDPLDTELLRQAASVGWQAPELLQALVEHASCEHTSCDHATCGEESLPDAITIRPLSLEPDELAQLVSIENASFATDAYQLEDFRNVYCKCSELSVVAEIAGQIAGYMMTRRLPDSGNVFSLAVAPAYRRRDVGEALFRYTANRLADWGIQVIELEVRATNEAARAFWERMGFSHAGELPQFYEDGAEAILMRRSIAANTRAPEPPAGGAEPDTGEFTLALGNR